MLPVDFVLLVSLKVAVAFSSFNYDDITVYKIIPRAEIQGDNGTSKRLTIQYARA